MSRVIGIDLGTANSCVSVVENGEPFVVPDEDGNKTQPSVFAINNKQEHLVGYSAVKQADINRVNTIFAVKRLIGRKFAAEEVQEFAARMPYKIVPADNGDAWVQVNDVRSSPEQVSSHILSRMKEIAENYFKESIHHAVITVPAHFNDAQRQATKDAGKIAGLQVLSIINEPTAAALAYGLDLNSSDSEDGKKESRVFAVFDLGSGTFDITILSLKNGVFDVLATGGDTYLGGEDFDLAILEYMLTEFKKSDNTDLGSDKSVLQRLKTAARDAKQDLSSAFTAQILIPHIAKGSGATIPKDLKMELERKTFERLAKPLLDRLEHPCLQAMEDAHLTPDQIDDVILVGGMTRMPAVKLRAQKIFGKKPIDTINPDEAVSAGAAIQGALVQGVLKGMKLADVTSLTLGIETQGGRMVPLLPRNSKIPAKVTEMLTTSEPNQSEVSIHVLQGESNFVPENKTLGRFELTGIRAARRGDARIEFTLEVDGDGIVHISAKDLETGERKEVEVINSSGLSEDEINKLTNKNRQNDSYKSAQQERIKKAEESAKKKKELAWEDSGSPTELSSARDELKGAIFQMQFKLDTECKAFKGKPRLEVEDCLTSARKALSGASDPNLLKDALSSLKSAEAQLESFIHLA